MQNNEPIKNFNPQEIEQEILQFWQDNDIYNKIKLKNKNNPKWTFLQGPPYTSGRLHMGHAWNHALKDAMMRYKRMKGFDVWDRNGYDMHGLPTEHKVQEKFNLKTKEDIEKFGYENFARECYNFCTEMAGYMDTDLKKMGVWMNYEDPYLPITNEFMDTEWWFIKKAYENNRLYQAERTLSWCASCETALAKHEQEYKTVTEPSIFIKFKIKNTNNEYLIIWTTTPWTIAFNMAIMVNPNVSYIKAKIDNEIWVVAEALSTVFIQGLLGKKYEILDRFNGDRLEGLEYIHPWLNEIINLKELKEKNNKIHTVLLSEEYVDTSGGSGLVHCAPGCGPEDYEVGYRNKIPPFNNLKENGIFPENMGRFSGLIAKKDDKKFVKLMKEDGFLIESTPVEHEYAHCERCHNPIVFRTTKQWFFKTEDLIEKMIENNQSVNWVPKQSKDSFDSWIKNLRDNSITKQRFWGTPVPIWKCSNCNEITVIGGIEELKQKAINEVPENIHKPFIDSVKLKCEKCQNEMFRIPDVIDVWIDSGVTQWACFKYPKRTDLFEKYYPVDFILEAKEQVRLWFYMLSLCQAMVSGNNPYKNVYCTGMLLGVDGVKMSKSLGNILSPYTIIEKHGVDTMRYYLSCIAAGVNVSFTWKEVEIKNRNLGMLWNVHKYLIELIKNSNVNIVNNPTNLDYEEKYILSRMNTVIKKSTEYFENNNLDDIPRLVEELYIELSRDYIKQIRDKVSSGTDEEKEVVISTIYKVLISSIKIMHPFTPFVTEAIYLNLKEHFELKDESIILSEFPTFDEKSIDLNLENSMGTCQEIVTGILALREKVKTNVRWPIKRVIIVTENKEVINSVNSLNTMIKFQTNVKEVEIKDKLDEIKLSIKPNFQKIGQSFGQDTHKVVEVLNKSDSNKILSEIEKNATYLFEIENKEYSINKDHLIIEKKIVEPLVMTQGKGFDLVLDNKRTEELDSEGYSREITRRIQSLRKESGFVKKDRIKLHIKTDMVNQINNFKETIAEKVGASEIIITNNDGKLEYSDNFKIKDKDFTISFNKI